MPSDTPPQSIPLPSSEVENKFEARLEYLLADDVSLYNMKASRWVALMEVRACRAFPPQLGNGSSLALINNSGGNDSTTTAIPSPENEVLRRLMTGGFYWFPEDTISPAIPLLASEIAGSGFDLESFPCGMAYHLTSTIQTQGEIPIQWEMRLKLLASSGADTLRGFDLADNLIPDRIIAVRGYNANNTLVYLHDHGNCLPQPSAKLRALSLRCDDAAAATSGPKLGRGSKRDGPPQPGSPDWWAGENANGNFNHVLNPPAVLGSGMEGNASQQHASEARGFFPVETLSERRYTTALDSGGPRPVQGCRTAEEAETGGIRRLRQINPRLADDLWTTERTQFPV